MSTASKEFFLTSEGINKLKQELDDLVSNQRQKVAESLKEAKEQGDLSENSMWDNAKDQQAFVEGRIAEIEHILKHTTVIESPAANDVVGLGSTVHVELESGKQIYTIVGSTEADPGSGKISNESPIGKALLGRKKGEAVDVEVPSGTMTYKIVAIK